MNVHVQITEYTVAPAPLDEDYAYDWALKVEWRGGGAGWAVTRNGRVLNVDGEWEYEPRPSERDEDGIAVLGAAANRGTGQAIAVFAGTDGHRRADAALAGAFDPHTVAALAPALRVAAETAPYLEALGQPRLTTMVLGLVEFARRLLREEDGTDD